MTPTSRFPSAPTSFALPLAALSLSLTAAAQSAPTERSADQPAAALQVAAPSHGSIGVSLDILAAVGSSTERDASLSTLQAGGHDPNQRGFTLQEAELGLSGAVDDSFAAEAMIGAVIAPETGETIVELEEAYLVTTALPEDLQLKAGHYLTEFGRLNPVHPHSWAFVDQPIINTRIFGADGMRAPGARLAWEVPGSAPTQLLVGIQNAGGEALTSFVANEDVYTERAIGGRFFTARENRSWSDYVYNARAETDRKLDDATTLGIGASIAVGPNATGDGADTTVYGADFALRWKGKDGRAFTLQGEVIARDFQAKEQIDANDVSTSADDVTVPGATLHDYGGYLQGIYQLGNGWALGLRGEWVSGSGASYDQAADTFGRQADPFRADRVRVSPLIGFETSRSSRLRLQYDYDDADHLEDPAHSVWLGFVVMIGQHPKHVYRPVR